MEWSVFEYGRNHVSVYAGTSRPFVTVLKAVITELQLETFIYPCSQNQNVLSQDKLGLIYICGGKSLAAESN